MNRHWLPGEDFSGARIGDTVTNYYGEHGTIVGESGRKTAWIVCGTDGVQRFMFKPSERTIYPRQAIA
jgi:hypothetical protein